MANGVNKTSKLQFTRAGLVTCCECGGSHEPSGERLIRFNCIRHWKLRALVAENQLAVEKHYGGILGSELRRWLDSQDIHGDNIGSIRRRCFMPWDTAWNMLVREETAKREKPQVSSISHLPSSIFDPR